MKNILAENMLRFRSKNIAAQEAAAIRKLIEQQTTTVKYKNPTDIDGFFTDTANGAMWLNTTDVKTVIFATTLKPGDSEFGAESGKTYCIKLSPKYFVAVGQIGTVDDAVNPVVNNSKAGAIYFSAVPAGTTAAGTGISSNPKSGQIGYGAVFIPYGNNLAKFANDIVRATKPTPGNKKGAFSGYGGMEKQIAAVLKASAGLGITGAEQLGDKKFYDTWKTATEDLLATA